MLHFVQSVVENASKYAPLEVSESFLDIIYHSLFYFALLT